jgi:hypothetical protein
MDITDKAYTEILRGIAYMFKDYSKTYNATAQLKYYHKKREAILAKMKLKYETDEAYRLKMIDTAKAWNKIYKD